MTPLEDALVDRMDGLYAYDYDPVKLRAWVVALLNRSNYSFVLQPFGADRTVRSTPSPLISQIDGGSFVSSNPSAQPANRKDE
jgi:hypothetical protein